jgi:hypothetical protein
MKIKRVIKIPTLPFKVLSLQGEDLGEGSIAKNTLTPTISLKGEGVMLLRNRCGRNLRRSGLFLSLREIFIPFWGLGVNRMIVRGHGRWLRPVRANLFRARYGRRRVIESVEDASALMMGASQNGQNKAGCKEKSSTNGGGAGQGIGRLACAGEITKAAPSSADPKAAPFGTLQKDKPDQGQGQKKMYDENNVFHEVKYI